ncbi:hypothetical protein ACFL2H_01810 [Planctomycetota bacterium]
MQFNKSPNRSCLMPGIRVLRIVVIALLLLTSVVRSNDVETNGLSITSVRVGFDGKFKVGHWVPVWVEFAGLTGPVHGTLSVSVPDGEGQPATYRFADTELTPESPNALCYVKFGRVQSSLRVAFTPANGDQASPQTELTASTSTKAFPTRQRFIVTLGNSVGIEKSLVMRSRRTDETVEHTIIKSVDELPDCWIGYAGVDVLVVPTRHGMWRQSSSDAKIAAIVKWVRLGGTIVFSCGEYADRLLDDGAPFREILPGTFAGARAERETSAVEDFVGGDVRLNISETDGTTLPYANLSDTKGRVLFSEGSGAGRHPAAIVGIAGLGNVVFVAFDLDSDSVANWGSQPELMLRFIELTLGPAGGDETTPVGMTQYGYDDIVGQLRMSMNSFTGVRVMPFSIVALLVATYVLFIGPIDYFFHHRFSKRFELTWLTFPLLVVAFCLLAYWLAAGQGRAAMQLNRVSVVDVDAESHEAIGSSWWYVYSPTNQKLNLTIDSNIDSLNQLDERQMMWDGLAGSGFGGMNGGITSRQDLPVYDILVRQTPNGLNCRLKGIPVDVRSSRSLYSQWTGRFGVDQNDSSLKAGIENQLEGDVVNSLPFTLDRCWLAYDRWVYKIGSLRPGQQKSLLGLTSRDLRSLMTKQEFVKSRYKTTPWDRDSTETDEIVRMMMFFTAVRGEAYTGLRHRYQDHIDCGQKLTIGRAMLVGESKQAPIKMMNSDNEFKATRAATYFRLSIPVESKR